MKRPFRVLPRRAPAPLAVLSLFTYLGAGGGCEHPTSPYDDVEWQCFEDEASCGCFGAPPGTKNDDRRPATPGCSAELDCCFVLDGPDGTYDCRCIPTPPDDAGTSGASGAAGAGGEGGAPVERSPESRCLLAAAERGSTTVTAHCPPITLNSAGVCALTFESCEPAYLKENGLVFCCDGLDCQADSTGQKICVVSN